MSLEEAAQAVHHHHDHNDQHDDDRDVDHAHAHAHEHGHSHDHLHADHGHSHGHLHDDSIKSFAISQPGLLDMDKVIGPVMMLSCPFELAYSQNQIKSECKACSQAAACLLGVWA